MIVSRRARRLVSIRRDSIMFFVFIVIVIALFVAWKYFSLKKAKEAELKRLQEQNYADVRKLFNTASGTLDANTQKAIEYFVKKEFSLNKPGFWPGGWSITFEYSMTPEQYDNVVAQIVGEKGTMEYALDACGLDESEVTEVEPIRFAGYNRGGAKLNREGRTERYEVAWMFFTSTELHLCIGSVNLLSGGRTSIETMEFFYRDVTTFRTSVNEDGEQEFAVVVPGERISLPLGISGLEASRLNGLKAKLREKKNA